jgi:hypothetical protein
LTWENYVTNRLSTVHLKKLLKLYKEMHQKHFDKSKWNLTNIQITHRKTGKRKQRNEKH